MTVAHCSGSVGLSIHNTRPYIMSLVLVTGASGFVGAYVVHQLLKDTTYRVRGTVRPAKAPGLRAAYAKYGDRYEVVEVQDLATSDLTEAFKGVDALIHVGSPLPGAAGPEVVLQSAIDGTRRVLDYALSAKVKKIIYTSTFGSLLHPDDTFKDKVFTESDWNPQTREEVLKPGTHPWAVYTASKAVAEKEIWKFADEHKDVDVTTILPSFVHGPHAPDQAVDNFTGTPSILYSLISGPKGRPAPGPDVLSPAVVHVEDVARAHVLALEAAPSTERKRILVNADYLLWKDAVKHLEKVRPELKDRLPSLENAEPVPATYAKFETKNAEKFLGIKQWKSWQQMVEEGIDDLLVKEKELGLSV